MPQGLLDLHCVGGERRAFARIESGQNEKYCLDTAYVHTNCIICALHVIYSFLSAYLRKKFGWGGSAINIVSTYRSQSAVGVDKQILVACMYQLTRFQLVILNQFKKGYLYSVVKQLHVPMGLVVIHLIPLLHVHGHMAQNYQLATYPIEIKTPYKSKQTFACIYSVIYSPVILTERTSFATTSSTPLPIRSIPVSLALQQYCHSAGISSVTVSTLVLTGCPRLLNMIRRVSPLSEMSVKLSQEPPATFVLLHMNVFGEITPSGAVAVQVIVNWL